MSVNPVKWMWLVWCRGKGVGGAQCSLDCVQVSLLPGGKVVFHYKSQLGFVLFASKDWS